MILGSFKKMPGESGEIGPSIHLLFPYMCPEHLFRAQNSAWHWGRRQPHNQVKHSSFFGRTHGLMGEEATTEKIITIYFSKHIRNEEEGVSDCLSHQKRFLRGSDMEQGTEG